MTYSFSKKSGIAALIFSACLCLQGCGPRGESDSLDGLLTTAKYRFERSKRAAVPADVQSLLAQVTPKLEALGAASSGSQVPSLAIDAAEALTSVINRAAYTSRPAMAELINQYRIIGEAGRSTAASVDLAAVKLLTSRTYQLLASELETTKFQVES